jgi:hypothetical protein
MNYSVSKLATTADCDLVLDRAAIEKAEMEHKLSGLVLETNGNDRSLSQVRANLASVNAQITGFEAARDALPEGPEKVLMNSKIRKLNDRKENLEERLSQSGSTGLLLTEMERGIIEKHVTELDTFITAVTTRKAAL